MSSPRTWRLGPTLATNDRHVGPLDGLEGPQVEPLSLKSADDGIVFIAPGITQEAIRLRKRETGAIPIARDVIIKTCESRAEHD